MHGASFSESCSVSASLTYCWKPDRPMDRIQVTRFSIRRKGSHRSKNEKEAKGYDYDQMSYLRYVV